MEQAKGQKIGKYFEGEPCRVCGSTLRYVKERRCVACRRERSKARHDRECKGNPSYSEAKSEYLKGYRRSHQSEIASYYQTEQGKAAIRRYMQSDKGRQNRRQNVSKRRAIKAQVVTVAWSEDERIGKWEQFGDCCAYCNIGGKLTHDHVVPLSRGGHHALYNIVPACDRCNFSKGDRDVRAWYPQQYFYEPGNMELIELCCRL